MDDDIPELVTQDASDIAPTLASVDIITDSTPRVPVTIITGFLGSGKVRRLSVLVLYAP